MIGEIIGLISLLLFPICTYLVAKKLKNDAIDDVLGYFESEEGLQYIYKMAVVAGTGIMKGTGINLKGKKFKLEDIIGQVIGSYVEGIAKKLAGGAPATEGQQKPKEGKSVPRM